MSNAKKVEKLIKQLNNNLDLYEVPKYKIIESSIKNMGHTYTVHNLEAEMEDGGVYFGDVEEIIYNNQYVLMGFLVDSIVDIIFEDKIITIVFKSNSIKIELVD